MASQQLSALYADPAFQRAVANAQAAKARIDQIAGPAHRVSGKDPAYREASAQFSAAAEVVNQLLKQYGVEGQSFTLNDQGEAGIHQNPSFLKDFLLPSAALMAGGFGAAGALGGLGAGGASVPSLGAPVSAAPLSSLGIGTSSALGGASGVAGGVAAGSAASSLAKSLLPSVITAAGSGLSAYGGLKGAQEQAQTSRDIAGFKQGPSPQMMKLSELLTQNYNPVSYTPGQGYSAPSSFNIPNVLSGLQGVVGPQAQQQNINDFNAARNRVLGVEQKKPRGTGGHLGTLAGQLTS